MELSKNEYYEKFSLCVQDRDVVALNKIKASLLKQMKEMDKWFDKYLEMFERKMDPEQPNTNIWKLYNKKSEEYSELKKLIIASDIYLQKIQNVQ